MSQMLNIQFGLDLGTLGVEGRNGNHGNWKSLENT